MMPLKGLILLCALGLTVFGIFGWPTDNKLLQRRAKEITESRLVQLVIPENVAVFYPPVYVIPRVSTLNQSVQFVGKLSRADRYVIILRLPSATSTQDSFLHEFCWQTKVGNIGQMRLLHGWGMLPDELYIDDKRRSSSAITNRHEVASPPGGRSETNYNTGAFSIHHGLRTDKGSIRAFLRFGDLLGELAGVIRTLFSYRNQGTVRGYGIENSGDDVNSSEERHYHFKTSHRAYLGLLSFLAGCFASLWGSILFYRNKIYTCAICATLGFLAVFSGMLLLLSTRHP
jgi:hypothetical protein